MNSRITSKKIAWQGNHLTSMIIDWKDNEGISRKWESVERITGAEIVSIVPITSKQEVILVSQFRPPVGTETIEFPAGLADKEDRGIEQSARRELKEETGYLAEKMGKLFSGPVSAGLSNENLTVFLATNLLFVGKKNSREENRITQHKVPLEITDEWLDEKEKEDVLVDVKVRGFIGYVKNIIGGINGEKEYLEIR